MNLFRGSEYQRFYWAAAKEPLTYYDMNLSAQDHQTFFTCECDAGKAEYELMQTAWRERNPVVRIKTARDGKPHYRTIRSLKWLKHHMNSFAFFQH